jgi:hypothetical protein
MFRVMLVNVPFANINRPSLGLSLLKAALVRENVHCDIAYVNMDYAQLIGRPCYKQLADFNTTALIGEWIFAAALFEQAEHDSLHTAPKSCIRSSTRLMDAPPRTTHRALGSI